MTSANTYSNSGSICYRAPSNIAFIKYWGKKLRQIPQNASLSMTLENCYTQTTISYLQKAEPGVQISKFELHSEKNLVFQQKIELYLNSIIDLLPWLTKYSFEIQTENSFPHSAGIASSASAFASLAMCLEELDSRIGNRPFSLKKASELARIGSGSAARSVYGGLVVWGNSEVIGSEDTSAIELKEFHPKFKTLKDSVLIVSSESKKVSSSVGHSLMNTHLFKEVRFLQAQDNLKDLIQAFKTGDIKSFGEIIEQEALTLHALMMTSSPSFILLEPASVSIIQKVKQWREEYKIPLYFTIDAGPNIHLIYFEEDKHQILKFINDELAHFCELGKVIHDEMGDGPLKIENSYE